MINVFVAFERLYIFFNVKSYSGDDCIQVIELSGEILKLSFFWRLKLKSEERAGAMHAPI
jgi:hypothetical protein